MKMRILVVAYYVDSEGFIADSAGSNEASGVGVRPVINVKL